MNQTQVEKAIAGVDPDQPLVEIQAATAMISDSISMPRFRSLLMMGFGLTALLLAMVGHYGVISYKVSLHTKEFGVRLALGAAPRSILGLVSREGGFLVGIGLAVGLAGALALSRTLKSMLFGVGSPGSCAVCRRASGSCDGGRCGHPAPGLEGNTSGSRPYAERRVAPAASCADTLPMTSCGTGRPLAFREKLGEKLGHPPCFLSGSLYEYSCARLAPGLSIYGYPRLIA